MLGTITTIGISPADHHVVWIGTDDGRVWRGVESGGVFAWTNVTAAPLPPRWVTRVVPHPTDPASAWVTYSGLKWVDPESHVFATTNSGASWTDISSNLPEVPINAMAVDPANPALLFVGTDLGAYYSDNGGGIWNYLSPDLPLVAWCREGRCCRTRRIRSAGAPRLVSRSSGRGVCGWWCTTWRGGRFVS